MMDTGALGSGADIFHGHVVIIQAPYWTAPISVALLGLVVYILFRISMKRGAKEGRQIEIPAQIPLGSQVRLKGLIFSNWDCRFKIAALVFYMFGAAFLSSFSAALIALLFSLTAAAACQVPVSRLVRRISAVSLFLFLILAVLPFSTEPAPGDIIIQFAPLSWAELNLRGLVDALVIILKACAIVVLMEPLFYSSPLSEFSNALISLKVPPKAVYILNLSTRYLNVMASEAASMIWALKARAFRPSLTISGLKALAGLFAMLFIRSYERTQRLQESMALRGFRGRFPRTQFKAARLSDLLKAALFVSAAIALHLVDRFWGGA